MQWELGCIGQVAHTPLFGWTFKGYGSETDSPVLSYYTSSHMAPEGCNVGMPYLYLPGKHEGKVLKSKVLTLAGSRRFLLRYMLESL
jgi:hypothetical protein